jgi:hypothetical protein
MKALGGEWPPRLRTASVGSGRDRQPLGRLTRSRVPGGGWRWLAPAVVSPGYPLSLDDFGTGPYAIRTLVHPTIKAHTAKAWAAKPRVLT